jgi:DMSO/TMAO reductase YedYZ molybdopterin-dependent catalytic subunit
MTIVSRGFSGRRTAGSPGLPPGQYLTSDFPVLSAGPTPRVPLDSWQLEVITEDSEVRTWSWEEFQALPSEIVSADIHCVTRWSKLNTTWEAVSLDVLLEGLLGSSVAQQPFATVESYGGYRTNLPLADLLDTQAWIAFRFGGDALAPRHGGPARLLVPHLYFWKSAKWVRSVTIGSLENPGFWETMGYHNYGDPWREQRYSL